MVLLQRTVERVFQLAVVQLYNPIDHSLWSSCDRVSMRSLVVVEETCMISHIELLRSSISQHLGLSIRSSLIECQSLLNRKININPKYRVLMFLPSTVYVLCSTWFIEVNRCKILMAFCLWDQWQKKYCLSSAQILTSRYQPIVDDRMKN